jgi:hypothetical protein
VGDYCGDIFSPTSYFWLSTSIQYPVGATAEVFPELLPADKSIGKKLTPYLSQPHSPAQPAALPEIPGTHYLFILRKDLFHQQKIPATFNHKTHPVD